MARPRVLGVCYDGPMEMMRVRFPFLPAKGDEVVIERSIRDPLPDMEKINGQWIEKPESMCLYEVTQIEEDSRGHTCVLLVKSPVRTVLPCACQTNPESSGSKTSD
jgi:hypothetical protein